MSTAPQPKRLQAAVNRLAGVDAEDLAELEEELRRVIIEDNRKGVLEGTDRNDAPMEPLRYRNGSGVRTRARSMRSESFGSIRGRFKGVAPAPKSGRTVLANNNLTTKAYQQLTGPRLAPRREASRVITNLLPLPSERRGDTLIIQCGWVDVVNPKGRQFLTFHFEGKVRGARAYDLRGVRRWGREKARYIVRQWISQMVGTV